jgi:hypothetical protein
MPYSAVTFAIGSSAQELAADVITKRADGYEVASAANPVRDRNDNLCLLMVDGTDGYSAVTFAIGDSAQNLALAVSAMRTAGYEIAVGATPVMDRNGNLCLLMVQGASIESIDDLLGGVVDLQAEESAGTAEAVTGLTVTEGGSSAKHTTTFTFVNTPLALADNPGVGQHGGFHFYTFPAGRMFVFFAAQDLTVTRSTGTLEDTFEGRIYIAGEDVGPEDGAADSLIANIAAAVGGLQTRDSITVAQTLMTDDPAELWFSMFVTDHASHTAAGCLVNGTVTITWFPAG